MKVVAQGSLKTSSSSASTRDRACGLKGDAMDRERDDVTFWKDRSPVLEIDRTVGMKGCVSR